MSDTRERFVAGYGFSLDRFQLEAIDALDAGRSVVVAAPTGSGKTVVAEYAIAKAFAAGRRAFYTTPLKALSNQKFADLCHRHGTANVGLLTGDNSINGDAPIVVMTTEVVRNMIYAGSAGLDDLAVVVLDEVHFLQDTYRGPVWEEVIIHLRHDVQLVCLSATVSNADELAEWMRTVRGPTAVVVEDRRPVTLHNLYLVGDRSSDRLHLLPTLVDGRPNPEAARLDGDALPLRRRGRSGGPTSARRRLYTPTRVEVVERLDDEGMLPAIVFIFSRNACDEAAQTCLNAGLRLTTAAERDRIADIVDAHVAALDAADLAVLGYARWRAALDNGIASHHAGLVPPFKEAVEACFVEGLAKVVFATETLAVGINMPARTVVIEKLSKFTGDHHEVLTPADYTQLTGRAGRRGIDEVGYALVLWSPFVSFDHVAALASSRSFVLRSAFRPTYNMAVNLVRSYDADEARRLLNLSFAQYLADRDVVKLEARLERRQRLLEELRGTATSPFGDLDAYRRLMEGRRSAPPAAGEREIDVVLSRLRPGDVVMVERGRQPGPAAVLSVAQRRGSPTRVRAITANRRLVALSAPDFTTAPRTVGRIDLPTPFAPNRQSFQREVARTLERAKLRDPEGGRWGRATDDDGPDHPVVADPELPVRLRAAAHADRVDAEVKDLRTRVHGATGSLGRRFGRVLEVLASWGYLSIEQWTLTDRGERLAHLFHECDLLVMESLERGLLDGFDAPTLAALVSAFTYEHRSPEAPPAPWFPSAAARRRFEAIKALHGELVEAERAAGLPLTRQPDPTFAAVAHAWAAGDSFAGVVAEEELSGGDFVRNVKQLIDLTRQLAQVAPSARTRATASEAADRLFRGVVAASAVVEVDGAAIEVIDA